MTKGEDIKWVTSALEHWKKQTPKSSGLTWKRIKWEIEMLSMMKEKIEKKK